MAALGAVLGLMAATGEDTSTARVASLRRPPTDDELDALDKAQRAAARDQPRIDRELAVRVAQLREERRQRKIAAYAARQPKP